MVGGIEELKHALSEKTKIVAMLAPSFVVNFSYPQIITQLKDLGIDKVVELTFGAKLVNKEYHDALKKSKGLMITSVCPGSVFTINQKMPKYTAKLARIDSPMIAMAKICKKIYPKHKILFISPCNFKKMEADKRGYVDIVLGANELQQLFDERKIKPRKVKGKVMFDKFYNDYTKIYPIAGGLSKTAHLAGVLKPGEEKSIDGIDNVMRFLKKPDKTVKFLDANFCKGGCIGGPNLKQDISIDERRKKVLRYLKKSKKEKMPPGFKGVFNKAKGIKFRY